MCAVLFGLYHVIFFIGIIYHPECGDNILWPALPSGPVMSPMCQAHGSLSLRLSVPLASAIKVPLHFESREHI